MLYYNLGTPLSSEGFLFLMFSRKNRLKILKMKLGVETNKI
jgi:hypothetical protein